MNQLLDAVGDERAADAASSAQSITRYNRLRQGIPWCIVGLHQSRIQ
jgi:hypothetical protein